MPAWLTSADSAGKQFCCYGCRLAHLVLTPTGVVGSMSALTRASLATFFSINVMMFSMVLWSQDVPHADHAEAQLAQVGWDLCRWVCLIGTLPVMYLLGLPLAEASWEQIERRQFTTDGLLFIGVMAAFIDSAVSVTQGTGHVYFEVCCLVLLTVTYGRWLEARGKSLAREAIADLEKTLPGEVTLVHDGVEQIVAADSLAKGDVVRVRAGETIPCDGTVTLHSAAVNQQRLTGESDPVSKQPGNRVLGGSICLDGQLLVEVDGPPNEGTFGRLLEMVRESVANRGRFELLSEQVSRWFALLVSMLAIAVAIVHGTLSGYESGIRVGLSVIIIACPCALALATPLAYWLARTVCAKHGVVVTKGQTFELLPKVTHVVFDKTGTLTTGTPAVVRWIDTARDEHEGTQQFINLQRQLLSLASTSNHPFSQAIARHLSDVIGANSFELINVTNHPGRGTSAQLATGQTVRLGSLDWLEREQQKLLLGDDQLAEIETAQKAGYSTVGFAVDGEFLLVALLQEQLRPEAEMAISQLRARGVTVSVLTGDHAGKAAQLERQLGVTVHAELLPEQKCAEIARLQKTGVVAMVGDGINDAPAIAQADLGIALGCAADLTRMSADVCLLGDDLQQLDALIELSARTLTIAKQNLAWSLVYNLVAIVWAVMGQLNPVVAAIAMTLSSLFVLSNSARINVWRQRSLTQLTQHNESNIGSPIEAPPSLATTHPALRVQELQAVGVVEEVER